VKGESVKFKLFPNGIERSTTGYCHHTLCCFESISANENCNSSLSARLLVCLFVVTAMVSRSSTIPPLSTGLASSTLSALVQSVQSRRWLALRRKTQRLDASTQGQLHDFLSDHMGNKEFSDEIDDIHNHDDQKDNTIPDDYEVVQKQLDDACARQEELEEKGKFLKARLESYEGKLNVMEIVWKNRLIDQSDEHKIALDAARNSKVQQLKESLQTIKGSYSSVQLELKQLQHQISSMNQRQVELKMKTQECKVVLEELEYTSMLGADSNRPEAAGGTQDHGLDDEEKGTSPVISGTLRTTSAPFEIESTSVVQHGAKENVDNCTL
jgi:hypothetical protein